MPILSKNTCRKECKLQKTKPVRIQNTHTYTHTHTHTPSFPPLQVFGCRELQYIYDDDDDDVVVVVVVVVVIGPFGKIRISKARRAIAWNQGLPNDVLITILSEDYSHKVCDCCVWGKKYANNLGRDSEKYRPLHAKALEINHASPKAKFIYVPWFFEEQHWEQHSEGWIKKHVARTFRYLTGFDICPP